MGREPEAQLNLFTQDPHAAWRAWQGFADQVWPAPERFPINRPGASTRVVVWRDLTQARDPLVVAGYSSLTQLLDLLSEWLGQHQEGQDGTLRVLFGAEPFPTARQDFSAVSVFESFTDEMRRYWLEERHVSLAQSGQVLQAIEALEQGRLAARCLPSLHAKAYIGETAATLGSSNFTATGLGSEQIEFNCRFTTTGRESRRYRELTEAAENVWRRGECFDEQLHALLQGLLRVVSWQEALARAAGELLEGEWAHRYLPAEADGAALWPAQRVGIAQALWVINNVGGVLVADATGSGKTRMGAHLIRAVRDWLWRTGRVRFDVATVICGPGVAAQWDRETLSSHVPVRTVSHGMLSRDSPDRDAERRAVSEADILAVDEAHNFLRTSAARTQQLQASGAEHLLLFTATPINRGRADLVQLASLLGPDNFDDSTVEILRRLTRPGQDGEILTQGEQDQLRRAIGRFTVRRTKTMLNELVTREPEAYRHPGTGRVCRYPDHQARTYSTGETERDVALATQIRDLAGELYGIAWLGTKPITPPEHLVGSYSDARWLDFRCRSARSLASFHVMASLRSSRAALVEHLSGTGAATQQFDLSHEKVKSAESGNLLAKLQHRLNGEPPTVTLDCEVPVWLSDPEAWANACHDELTCYQQILTLVGRMSAAREHAKASQIAALHDRHPRLLAFDQHPITLHVITQCLRTLGLSPEIASANAAWHRRMTQLFAPEAVDTTAVALCSDAFSEGYNLQGASALVHLDLPTTLRVAEQRVGRLDRMDSPHRTVEAWWPDDGPAFATRAYELLAGRLAETHRLIGGNLEIPALDQARNQAGDSTVIDTATHIQQAQQHAERRDTAVDWDGLRDAMAPVRELVGGDAALVGGRVYEHYRHSHDRVLACISPLRTRVPWAFFAVTASTTGAPYWMLLDQLDNPQPEAFTDLDDVCARLRSRLADNPEPAELDQAATAVLDRGLERAARAEYQMLPLRMRRALDQMRTVTRGWTRAHVPAEDHDLGQLYQQLADLANTTATSAPRADPYIVAERWLSLVTPYLDNYRRHSRDPLLRIDAITPQLQATPPTPPELEATFSALPTFTSLDKRTTACILGVPARRDTVSTDGR